MGNPVNTSQKVELRTLRLTELSIILEDINYNFSILRSHPMFQGIKGDTGTPGIKGSAGTRGSRWLFFYKSEFQNAFPSTDFSRFDTTNRYVNWLNTQILSNVTRPIVLSTLSISELVDTDIVVLPNTAMIQYNSSIQQFEPTGVQINAESGYVKQEDLEEAISNVKSEINEGVEFVGIPTYIKSFGDGTDAANNNANEYSYYDAVEGSNATKDPSHRWFGPYSDDKQVKEATTFSILAGLKEWYHQIISSTINGRNYSSAFVPGPNRMPAFVMFQNDTNSGMMLGPKPGLYDNTGIDKFGRIYMGEGVTIDGISRKITRDASKYGLHLFSNLTGSTSSAGNISEVFITPSTIYLISSLVEAMKDMLIHGNLEVKGSSKFALAVEMLKSLTIAETTKTKNLTVTETVTAKNGVFTNLRITNVTNAQSNKILVIDDNNNVRWANLNSGDSGTGGLIDYGATESFSALTEINYSDVRKPSFTGKIPSATNLNTITDWVQRVYSAIIARCKSIESKNSSQDQTISTLQTTINQLKSSITNIEAKNTEQDTKIKQNADNIKNIGDVSSGVVSGLVSRVSAIETSIESVKTDVKKNKDDIAVLATRVSTLETNYSDLLAKYNTLSQTLNTVKSTADSALNKANTNANNITNLTNRVANIESGNKLDSRYLRKNVDETTTGTITGMDFIATGV